MSIISEVKCSQCDRRFSGFRARCPYCGARRSQRGKHANENDNSKGRIIITLVLVVLLILAVVVLIVTSGEETPLTDNEVRQTPKMNEDVSSFPGNSPSPSVSPSPSPSVSPSPSPVASELLGIGIYFLGDEKRDVTLAIGDVIDFDYKTDPEDAEVEVKWSSSDEDAFVVLQTGEVTALSETDGATLTVTSGDVSATCVIRIY